MGRNSFIPTSKVSVSLCWSHKINLHPEVQYHCPCAYVNEIHACVTNFCKEITSGSVTKSQTKWMMWSPYRSSFLFSLWRMLNNTWGPVCKLHGFILQIPKSLFLTEHNVHPKETIFIHINNDYCFPANGFHIYLSSRSISINSNMSIHLSSSGMWSANIDTGSSQSILQPRMSDSFRAWTCRDWLGTRAHWWGFKHCTLSLGGNCS